MFFPQPIPIPMEDDLVHTTENPVCAGDPTCPCHEDPDLLAAVSEQVEQGLLTSDEATRFVQGRQV